APMVTIVLACGAAEDSRPAHHTSISRSRAHRIAAKIGLDSADFPRGTTAIHQPFTARDRSQAHAEARRCGDRVLSEWTVVRSDNFTEPTGNGTRGTFSGITIFPSAGLASRDIAESRKSTSTRCWSRVTARNWAHTRFRELGGGYPTVRGVRVSPLTVPA